MSQRDISKEFQARRVRIRAEMGGGDDMSAAKRAKTDPSQVIEAKREELEAAVEAERDRVRERQRRPLSGTPRRATTPTRPGARTSR